MIPLWRQLQAAASVIESVERGRSLTATLAPVAPDLRPGVQALVHEALRGWGLARSVRATLATRQPPPAAHALLGLALSLACRPEQLYDPHTLVNQTVEAAKRQRSTAAQANFINACLRRFARERPSLLASSLDTPQGRWNLPDWWVERVQADWPQDWRSVLQESTARAAMTLRVNARKTDATAYLAQLRARSIEAWSAGTHTVVLRRPVPVDQLPGFSEGQVSVQDAAAQLAAPCLWSALRASQSASAPGTPPGGRPRILDACAAPGGKTAHLLELGDADVTALEIDSQRMPRIHDTLGRLGLQARVICADASRPDAWWDGQPYDAILLDAPCTASGIVRRHPDIAWLRRAEDVGALARVQAALLQALWPLLRPGGVLLYCTCSVFRDEGERQIESFVVHNRQSVLLPAPGHLRPRSATDQELCQDNGMREHDGFFHALLQKAP